MTPEMEEHMAEQSRAYLGHVRKLVGRKDAWELTIEHDGALLDGLRGIDYTRERVSGTPTPPEVVDLLERLERNMAQHQANMAELVDVVEDAKRRIMELDGTHARLLLLRYVEDMDWETVARRMFYSVDYCKKELHRAALVEMHGHLPTEWRDPRHPAV